MRIRGYVYLQRCLPRRDTAAPNENLELQAVDATDASLSDGKLRAVYHTARS